LTFTPAAIAGVLRRLENRSPFTRTAGSNPAPSARRHAAAQNRQRVAPAGSVPLTQNTVCVVTLKRCHGGGPALGAL
jgi:hypothetical protein